MAATMKDGTRAAKQAGVPQARQARGMPPRDGAPSARGDRPDLDALYPPGRRPTRRRGYLDDTLDAHPPAHLYSRNPKPEQVEAAKQLVRERGLLPRAAAKVRRVAEALVGNSGQHRRPRRAAETRRSAQP